MDRCALFVDAGYALADGAMAVHGTRRRDSVSWDHAGLLKLLAGLARDRTNLPVLRCYWYETAAEGRRTAEHDALAEMPGLKLRLVNTLPGRREGIESQLRRDLVTLAKSGAISDAFIVSANEHVAEIVAEVQDLGLRVVVLHIATDGGWTIPLPLRQECDDIVEISGVHLRSYVDLIKGAEPVSDEPYKSASVGAMTHQGLPAVALPGSGAVYQVHDVREYRHDGVAYARPGLTDSRVSAQSAAGSGGQEPSQPGSAAQAAPASASPQSGAPSAPAGLPPYSVVAGQSAQSAQSASMAQPAEVPGGYQNGAPHLSAGFPADPGSYQNGSTGNYQNAALQNGSRQAGTSPNGMSNGGVGQNSAIPHFDGQNGPGQNGAGQESMSQNGSGRPGNSQNGFPGDSARGGLGSGAYQQGDYQRGPGQVGSGHIGFDQQGPGGQDGHGLQMSGHAGAPQYGYPVGPQGQTGHGMPQSGHPTGGSTDQTPSRGGAQGGYQAGQQGTGPSPAQPAYPQGSAGHGAGGMTGQGPNQVPSGMSQPGYQNGPTGMQVGPTGTQTGPTGGPRGGAAQSGFQPGAPQPGPQQPDPRSRDPYGPGLSPQVPVVDAGAMPGQAQYAFGAPEVSFGHGNPGAGSDLPQRAGFGSNPGGSGAAGSGSGGQNASGPNMTHGSGAVVQPQYQMPQQAAASLPAIRVQHPVAIALPDAVKAAHAEGFSFGESVGRDAPGLWLEAVLARKPRMPSDLEARLLQGSVLPIDSLLHDEVRHSLRRGFWDALESARR